MPKIDKDWNPGRHTQFSSTNQPKNRGRKPKLKNIPDNAREKVMEALFHALTLPDQRTAMEYLKKEAKDLPEFGYLIQVYAKGMMGKNGYLYVSDLLDRLFGKPKQAAEITADIGIGDPPVIVFGKSERKSESESESESKSEPESETE